MLWDCLDAGLCSPPSLLAGHNGLVAVSTKSRVLSPLSQGDSGEPVRVCAVGKGGSWWAGGSHRAVGRGALPGEGGTTCKRVLRGMKIPSTCMDGQRDAVLPAGCLPAAGRGAHSRAGETPRAGRRGCHGGDRARYPCTTLAPPAPGQPWARAPLTVPRLPGFKFSRASYLLSLLRPQIYTELELQVPAPIPRRADGPSRRADRVSLLPSCPCRVGPAILVLQRHGLRVLPRDPYSFTPLLEDRSPPRSLLLGHNMAQTQQQIAQFSQKDAQVPPGHAPSMAKLPRGCPAHGVAGMLLGGVSIAPTVAQSLLSPLYPLFRLTLSTKRSWGAWCRPSTRCWMPRQWIQLLWGRAPCSSGSGPCEPSNPCCRQVRLGCQMAKGICLHLGQAMQSCPFPGHRLLRSTSWAGRLWQACPPWSHHLTSKTQPGMGSWPWHSHAGLTPLLHPQGWHWGSSCPAITRCSQPPSPR